MDASLLLVQDALVQIRAMAYLRRDLSADGGDYRERIRLIADVCENLPGHLRVTSTGTPLEGLQYAWDKANDAQQQWLQDTLARHDIVITDLITTEPEADGGDESRGSDGAVSGLS